MAHGISHGWKHGWKHGAKHGSLLLDALSGVPRDATSGKYVPLTQAEWDAVFDAAGVARKTVNSSWGFQNGSGNITATVGTQLTATIASGVTYAQAVSGWTRVGLQFADAADGRVAHAAGVGPNPNSTSVLWFVLADITAAPAGNRNMLGVSFNGAPSSILQMTTTPAMRIIENAVTVTGTDNTATGGVRPFWMKHSVTNSQSIAYSDKEKLVETYAAIGDGVKGIGSTGASSTPMQIVLGALFSGTNADWTDTEIKNVTQTLGFPVTGY